VILDTSFLVDVLRGDDAVVEWERRLDGETLGLVTSVSVMELWEGIQLADASSEERAAVRTLLEGLVDVAFDRPAAMRAGQLNAVLRRRGEPVAVEDVMMGAVALERDEPVLTRNASDFERLPDLEVVTY